MKMFRTRQRIRLSTEETDLDMVPIMNMFLVLIPFLLMSASFLHLKAINTSVPVLGNAKAEPSEASDIRLTLVLTLTDREIKISALSENLDPKTLSGLQAVVDHPDQNPEAYKALSEQLRAIKATYPKSDTVILVPDPGVVYETIIETMDVARKTDNGPLFPNVVLSGKVG